MGKYITLIYDKPYTCEGSENVYRMVNSTKTFTATELATLFIPYTEPDLDAIRKEACEGGYIQGYITGYEKADKAGQKFYEDGYQRGLFDAWEVARKIVLPGDVSGIYLTDLEKIFDRSSLQAVIKNYSASECIEKIRQYEQEREEIQAQNGRNEEIIDYIHGLKSKYGYSINEIAEVLEKMKEE